jgi:hypothetical protein
VPSERVAKNALAKVVDLEKSVHFREMVGKIVVDLPCARESVQYCVDEDVLSCGVLLALFVTRSVVAVRHCRFDRSGFNAPSVR